MTAFELELFGVDEGDILYYVRSCPEKSPGYAYELCEAIVVSDSASDIGIHRIPLSEIRRNPMSYSYDPEEIKLRVTSFNMLDREISNGWRILDIGV